ncbi:MAG: VanW family protein [Acidimicrobiia bacterium]|jgi:vancomycin resistance protein YoaR
MKKELSFPFHPLLVAVMVAGALVALLFGVYGLTRWLSAGEVMGHVRVAEVDLGGQTEDEALNSLVALEGDRLTREAAFVVDGQMVDVEPRRTGLAIDEQTHVQEAMAVGREGNFATQFLFWLSHVFSTTDIDLVGTVDEAAVDELFDAWDADVIGKPTSPGSIELRDTELVPVYPAAGVGVERESASEILLTSLLAESAETEEIPTVTVVPRLTDADVDAALAEAQLMLSGPITLAYEDTEAILDVSQLRRAFVSETVTQSEPQIVNSFDPEIVDLFLAPIRDQFEDPPVDAELVINDDDTVSVQPGSNGTRIDEVETANRLYDAAFESRRVAQLPIVEGAEPEVTTEYLESLDVEHLVSQFTTYHDCCEARVTNIQLMADAIDGTIVLPGEIFSINDHVGERTAEKGYLPAGSIVGGEIVDTYGGGVSQFATTFYNAVYWGGYEDIEHKPHSYYFSRYPEGVEATLFWRSIDLKFRNNRDHAVLIDTRYTGNSITVRFFGSNDGRTLIGEQSGGSDKISVAREGGPDALHVKSSTSERYNLTSPREPEYRPNPDLAVDRTKTIQSERDGWSVTVTRSIFRGGIDLVEEQEWVVRYSPKFAIFEVHPCMMPDTETPCPSTTTIPPSTTTTVEPATTTTTGE